MPLVEETLPFGLSGDVANIVPLPEPELGPDAPGPYLSIDSVVDVASIPVPTLGVRLRL